MSDQDGVLQANLPADRARLERLLAAAVPVARGGVGGSMLLGRGGTVAPLVVHVQPVAASHPYGLVTALLLLVEPARRGHIEPVVVARTLGLTPAESRVAVRLAEGQTVRDIAAATGRKEGSIRWHLKRIYDKRGTLGASGPGTFGAIGHRVRVSFVGWRCATAGLIARESARWRTSGPWRRYTVIPSRACWARASGAPRFTKVESPATDSGRCGTSRAATS